MAMERWIAGQEGNEAGIEMARTLLRLYGEVQLGPQPVTAPAETFSPQALEAEIERQTRLYIVRDFHKRLRMSESRFKDHLMELAVPQPEAFRGRFNIPVIAFGQIPTKEQARLAGINYYLDGINVSDWEEDPQGYITPKRSYLTWMQDGTANLNRKPTAVRDTLAVDERGATIQDGIGLYVAHPEVLNSHYLDLPGTSVGSGCIADLVLWDGRPELGSNLADDADPRWGSASCGRV